MELVLFVTDLLIQDASHLCSQTNRQLMNAAAIQIARLNTINPAKERNV
jgi:hypothetical protein